MSNSYDTVIIQWVITKSSGYSDKSINMNKYAKLVYLAVSCQVCLFTF